MKNIGGVLLDCLLSSGDVAASQSIPASRFPEVELHHQAALMVVDENGQLIFEQILNVFGLPAPIGILAVNDLGLLGMKFQTALGGARNSYTPISMVIRVYEFTSAVRSVFFLPL